MAVFDHRGEYDENWPLPKHLTFEQYRRVTFRPDAHFVEGRIVPRTLGDRTHSDGVVALTSALQPLCRAQKLLILPQPVLAGHTPAHTRL